MPSSTPVNGQKLAFGVDPKRREKFSLRQSRYYEIGVDVARLGQLAKDQGRRLQVLDVGFGGGVSMRYIEVHEGADNIDYHGVDLKLIDSIYKRECWSGLYEADLTQGLPFLDSDQFDVVICEQVLEHLHEIDLAMSTLHRVLTPGGTLIVGVPIFPPGLHLVRRHLVPVLDRVLPLVPILGRVLSLKQQRGHVRAFSKYSFISDLRRNGDLQIQQTRGFRIVSGGLLRPLENFRWCWRVNRFIGAIIPSLCIEIQVVAQKPLAETTDSQSTTRRSAAA